jgi:hypothetical protein
MANSGVGITLNEVLSQRAMRETLTSHATWDSAFHGLVMIDEKFDQFITQVMEPTGFVWGKSIWGVDAVDDEVSQYASKYGLG